MGDENLTNLPCFKVLWESCLYCYFIKILLLFLTMNSMRNAKIFTLVNTLLLGYIPGRVAQSVMCLATDASLTADPGSQV